MPENETKTTQTVQLIERVAGTDSAKFSENIGGSFVKPANAAPVSLAPPQGNSTPGQGPAAASGQAGGGSTPASGQASGGGASASAAPSQSGGN